MAQSDPLKILFVINSNSGKNTFDWTAVISDYFSTSDHLIEFHHLPEDCNIQTLQDKIKLFAPQQVIAVGGDGTIKLVAECLLQKDIVLGILPGGSANGLAKELGIGNNPQQALDVLAKGHTKKIHLTTINDHVCIHLSDIGLNAYAIKQFESRGVRGMWGYLMATLKVLWQNPLLEVKMQMEGQAVTIKAEMIVIANGTEYGSGARINPVGRLDDELFEVIAVKKISVLEILKMVFTHTPYNKAKTEVFQTADLTLRSAKRVHFQVDGEYLGKIKEVKAVLVRDALEVIVPADDSAV